MNEEYFYQTESKCEGEEARAAATSYMEPWGSEVGEMIFVKRTLAFSDNKTQTYVPQVGLPRLLSFLMYDKYS